MIMTTTTPTRRSTLHGIAAGLALPALATITDDADAELIRACGGIVVAQTRLNALYKVRRAHSRPRKAQSPNWTPSTNNNPTWLI
jgi:hypothetical protein